ncbi:MAG TPA: cytochrome c oxidase assembly protein [Intrasporangium sp.]|nr:cytochrome c oxidase assembly protein [Intrasporangium sp.]
MNARSAIGLVALGTLGVVASALAVRSTGAADPLFFVADAGPLVRWSAPLLRVVHDLAAALTLGALVLALVVLRAPMLPRLAGIAAVVWAACGLGGTVLTFADASGLPLESPGFLAALRTNVWAFEATRIGLISSLGAAIVALGALSAARPVRQGTTAALLGVAIGSVAVLGLASHTDGSSDHETSVNAMAVHIVAAATWVGGLLALVVLRPTGVAATPTVRRWSTIALWCFCAVAVSGVVAATTRLGSWSDLTTAYGVLVVVKAVALLALGVAGWLHRRWTIPRLEESGRGFWRLAAVEVAVMAATIGVATALTRSAPPLSEDVVDPTPALALTGFPAPAAPGAWSWLLPWRTDWLMLTLAAVAISTYAAGLVRLRRAGRAWPGGRTAAWVAGWVVFAAATSGGAGTFGRVALSWHLALVLVELLIVPVLLVIGDPVGLAVKASAPREDGTIGIHETGLAVARAIDRSSRQPFVVVGVTALALIGLVLGPGLEWTLLAHPGHVIATVALPLLGYVLVSSILEASRVGARTLAVAALVALLVVIGLLGLALGLGTRPLAAEFFEGLRLPWLTNVLVEQRRAGIVVWWVGGLGTAALLAVVAGVSARTRPARRR